MKSASVTPLKISRNVLDGDVTAAVSIDAMVMLAAKSWSLETFLTSAKSWFVGDNIPGKAHAVLLYANTAPAYRAKLAETSAKGYEGFELR
jgi:hypothetical protein